MVTPFKGNGTIDFDALDRLTNHLIAGGVDYLVVQGTTGESPTVSKEEKMQLLDRVAQCANGRLPIVLGVGGNNTMALCRELEQLNHSAVAGILSASPYYNKPIQSGIIAHYKALSGSTDLPIILYNVPGRTASNMTADTTLTLAHDCRNVVAVKEASGNMDQIMTIIAGSPDGFDVISGDDALTLPMIASGAKGVISVVANAFPRIFSEMVHAAMAEDFTKARPLHLRLLEITRLFFAEGNPGGVKEALEALGICERHLRLPLVNVSASTAEAIRAEMKKQSF
jgi:4-hydroxy-tetrahydrodipicolinate synthase